MNFVQFFSGSACPTARHLSNFSGKIKLSKHPFHGKNVLVETAFQIEKILFCDPKFFETKIGDKILKKCESFTGVEARRIGGKTFFKNHGIKFDKKWDGVRRDIMKKIIRRRFASDKLFREILRKFDYFYHFQRRGARSSFWGGAFAGGVKAATKKFGNPRLAWHGRNELGKILREVKLEFINKK